MIIDQFSLCDSEEFKEFIENHSVEDEEFSSEELNITDFIPLDAWKQLPNRAKDILIKAGYKNLDNVIVIG